MDQAVLLLVDGFVELGSEYILLHLRQFSHNCDLTDQFLVHYVVVSHWNVFNCNQLRGCSVPSENHFARRSCAKPLLRLVFFKNELPVGLKLLLTLLFVHEIFDYFPKLVPH